MTRKVSPLQIGLLIYATYTIVNRFIIPLPAWLAIPVLVLGIILIIYGGLKRK